MENRATARLAAGTGIAPRLRGQKVIPVPPPAGPVPPPAGRRRAMLGLGFAGVAALAGIAYYLTPDVGRGGQAARAGQMDTVLRSQIVEIEQRIVACITAHPSPAQPFPLPWPQERPDRTIEGRECPGNGGSLWDERQGFFQPNAPSGFGGWEYRAEEPLLYLVIEPLAGDPARLQALERLAALFPARGAIEDGAFRYYLRR